MYPEEFLIRISTSLHEGAIKVPPLSKRDSCFFKFDDIAITDLVRVKLLEEIEAELPKSLKRKPASEYVRLVLKEKIDQRSDLAKLKENILQKLSAHKDVQDRDKQDTPLNEFEKKYFKSLLERIMGGCIVQAPFLPAIEKTKEFAKALFENVREDVRVGTMISFIGKRISKTSFNGMAALSNNTLRKVISQIAPESAFRRGRGNPADMEALELEAKRLFGEQGVFI